MGKARLAWVIVLAALGVCLWQGWLAIQDPTFGTDSGYRVAHGAQPVAKVGNRVWLPFLQVQIWLYHLLRLPVVGLKLITVFYLGLGLACLGLFWREVLGRDGKATALGVVAVLCFAASPLPYRMSELMQEQVGFGLYFLCLWLAARGQVMTWVALAAGCAAMLTRDSYWFYLFAFMLVDLWNWPWEKRRILFYAALCATPVLWMGVCVPALYVVAYGRMPRIPVEWPFMYNPLTESGRTMTSGESLRIGIVDSRVVYVAAGVAIAALIVAVWRWGRPEGGEAKADSFARPLLAATAIALAIVYGLILAVDPWQVTPGNRRQAWPLLELAYTVAPLLIRMVFAAPAMVRAAVTGAVVVGMVAGVMPEGKHDRMEEWVVARPELARLKSMLDEAGRGRPVSVCVSAADPWDALSDLSGPIFYHRFDNLERKGPWPAHCRVAIREQGTSRAEPGEPFARRGVVNSGRRQWEVYVRPGRDSRAPGS